MASKYLSEVVDWTPARFDPTPVTRGTIYQVLRQRGESDFIASTYAFGKRLYTGGVPPMSADDFAAMLEDQED